MIAQPQKTFADFMATALCPILIFFLTGTSVFFLLKISFAENVGQLYWIFFWFVLAIVAISRIAIEKSSESATVYGMLLATAVTFRVTVTVGFHLSVFLVIALIWWMTNRLVFACTDWEDQNEQDAGFTKSISYLKAWLRPAAVKKVAHTPPQPSPQAAPEKSSAKKPRSNQPEWWIFLAAAAAIPLFGFGEKWLSPTDRKNGFLLLLIYLASSFGLLLATSFLARRHQWRQRFIQMPSPLAFHWVGEGILILCAALLIAFFLPRPETSFSAGSIYRQVFQRFNGMTPVPTDALTELSSKLIPTDKLLEKTTPARVQPTPEKPQQAKPQPSQELDVNWSRWLLLAGGVALLLFLLYSMRRELGELLKRKRKPSLVAGSKSREKAVNEFRRMRNPFSTNEWEKMDPVELLNYTYRGMGVWAQSRGVAVGSHMTPGETAEKIIAGNQSIQTESEIFVRALLAANYGGRTVPPASIDAMRQLWSHWKTMDR